MLKNIFILFLSISTPLFAASFVANETNCAKLKNEQSDLNQSTERYNKMCKSNPSYSGCPILKAKISTNTEELISKTKSCKSFSESKTKAAPVKKKGEPSKPTQVNCPKLREEIWGDDGKSGLAKKLIETRIDEGFLKFSYLYFSIARKAANRKKISDLNDNQLLTEIKKIMSNPPYNNTSPAIQDVETLFQNLMKVSPGELSNNSNRNKLISSIKAVSEMKKTLAPDYVIDEVDEYIFQNIMIESLNNPDESGNKKKVNVFDEILTRFNEDALFSSFEDKAVVAGSEPGSIAKAMKKMKGNYSAAKAEFSKKIALYLRNCKLKDNEKYASVSACFAQIQTALKPSDEKDLTKILQSIIGDHLSMPGMRKLLNIESKPDRFRRCQFLQNGGLNANIDLTEIDDSIINPKDNRAFLGYRYMLIPSKNGSFTDTTRLPVKCRGSSGIIPCSDSDTKRLKDLATIESFESGEQDKNSYLKNRNFNLTLSEITDRDKIKEYSFVVLREYQDRNGKKFYSNPDVVSLQACIEKTEKSAPVKEPIASSDEDLEPNEGSCKLEKPIPESLVRIENCEYKCRIPTHQEIESGINSYELVGNSSNIVHNPTLNLTNEAASVTDVLTNTTSYINENNIQIKLPIPTCRPVCDSGKNYYLIGGKCTICDPTTHILKDNNCTPKPADKPAEDKPAEKPAPKPEEKPKDNGECKEPKLIIGAAGDKNSCEEYDNEKEMIIYQYDEKKKLCCPQRIYSPMLPTNRPASPQPMKGIMDNNGGAKLVL